MADKITPQSEAGFVKTLMDTDFYRHRHDWTNEDRLDYLKIIGNYADDVGEKIYRTENLGEGPTTIGDEVKTTIGEDRSELEDTDIDISHLLQRAFPEATVLNLDREGGLLDLLIDAFKPEELDGCLSPRQFCRSGECLKDHKAVEWLYANKYNVEYRHIHVFPYDLVLVMSSDGPPAWIKQDGVQLEGDLYDVIQAMFHEYTEAYLEEKQNG